MQRRGSNVYCAKIAPHLFKQTRVKHLFSFGCFYSALAVAILSPTIGSAQQYRGWEYISTTLDGVSGYARLVLRSGDLIDLELKTSEMQGAVTLRYDCAAWKGFDPRKKQWDQVMPKSMFDTMLKKFC